MSAYVVLYSFFSFCFFLNEAHVHYFQSAEASWLFQALTSNQTIEVVKPKSPNSSILGGWSGAQVFERALRTDTFSHDLPCRCTLPGTTGPTYLLLITESCTTLGTLILGNCGRLVQPGCAEFLISAICSPS